MNTNDEDIKDLEKYTFSNHWNNQGNKEGFSQINSFTNNFILNYQPSNNINNKTYNNNIEIIQKLYEHNKDINYNKVNVSSHQKSPLKNHNINSINNLNLIPQYRNNINKKRNYNHINNENKINININNNNFYKKNSNSKETKNIQRRKYRTPDKNMNYNVFNYITPNDSSKRKNRMYNKNNL